MREAKSMPDLCWWIVSVPSSFVWLTAADAAGANRPDGSSTSGDVMMAARPNIVRGESSTVSVLARNSREIRRVVRNSLGAECAAFSTGLEHTNTFRMLYGDLCGDLCDLAEYETHLQVTEALCVNDCKSLADALLAAGSAASTTSEDKRLGIELSMIKQRPSRNETRVQWVESATMPADVVTKGNERGHVELLRKLLHTARNQALATSEMLEERRQAGERRLLRHQERR